MVLLDPGNDAKIFISKNKLKAFLYLVMHDVLPVGTVFDQAKRVNELPTGPAFDNDPLALYAEQLILHFFLNVDMEVETDEVPEVEELPDEPSDPRPN